MSLERVRYGLLAGVCVCLLVSGVFLTGWLLRAAPTPPVRTSFSQVLKVAAVPVEPTVARVPVVGYGSVRPKNQVNIVPQVSGQLIFTHEDLLPGKVISTGELLFEIEPTLYEARVRQAEAEVRALEAASERHDQEVANLETRISNVAQMVEIAERDYLTSKRLYEVDSVGSPRDVDLILQKYLQQKDVLVELSSRKATAPHVKRETLAQLDAARARLSQARDQLENTKILCPFEARVEAVGAYRSQVVTAHLSIATLTDTSAFEISVGIDPQELRWLDASIRPSALTAQETPGGPDVAVRWSLPGQDFSWRGSVTRFERVDEATRTARMVVEIRNADMVATLNGGASATSPLLSIGMHCRAELPAQPLENALLVPRHAIYEERWTYVFQPDPESPDGRTGRLERRAVPSLRALGDYTLVDFEGRDGSEECELRPGERVVVSPLTRPVVGMKVALRDGTDWVAGGPAAEPAATLTHLALSLASRSIPPNFPAVLDSPYVASRDPLRFCPAAH